ncbi:Nuclear receptor domain-containing protein [Trichostrongylus colubriformis]|uniref:Nuclear receptor domain-containing protein n=1 Tax=Trichostrongylus colubriformis TaxID=6319 RepID=A0AAN8IS66_TRICO
MYSTTFPWFSPYSPPNDRQRGPPPRISVVQQAHCDQGDPISYSSFFSHFPLGSGLPLQELDYHLQEGTATQRQNVPEKYSSDATSAIADAGALQKHVFEVKPIPHYSTRGFADTELSLFNHTTFQYPVSSMDISHFPVKKEEFSLHQPASFQSFTNPPSDLPPQCSSISRQTEKACNTMQNCQVCHSTLANGLHFGARTCAACAAFFRRTISDGKKYVCKRSQRCNNPTKDATGYRKICRSCRLKRCMDIGMLPDNVQHKRCRRSSSPSAIPKQYFINLTDVTVSIMPQIYNQMLQRSCRSHRNAYASSCACLDTSFLNLFFTHW